MRRLYVQIAAGVALAVLVGWTAVALFLPRLRAVMEQSLGDQMLDSGLRAVGARLSASEQRAWPTLLDEARREITMPLAVIESRNLPPDLATRGGEPRVAHVDGALAASIYIPLSDGSHVLVAGPLEQVPVVPLAGVAIVFVVVLTVTASVFVGVPLVRRIGTIRNALASLGQGRWDTRLEANRDGILGELAESVNVMAAQLQQQFQEREALLQAVSHEMGTPLARMRFGLEMLEPQLGSPDQRKRLDALAADLAELDELSSELVSWMETEAAPQAHTAFDAMSMLEPLVELEGISPGRVLTMSLEPVARPVVIHADPRQFQRAMENLLRNAARYAASAVVVRVSQVDDRVAVDICDDGPGIPAQERSRVLEPFVRGATLPSRAHRGLGLGLAIVRRIVTAHGGTLTVGEAPEGGALLRTTWSAVLPT